MILRRATFDVLALTLRARLCGGGARATALPDLLGGAVGRGGCLLSESEKLLVEQSELAWRNWVLGDPLELTKTTLATSTSSPGKPSGKVRALEALTTDPLERRALGIFRVYLTGEIRVRRDRRALRSDWHA